MEFRQRLGSGGFADVFEGFYGGHPVAVKRRKTSTKNPAATDEAFEAEAALPPLQHPHNPNLRNYSGTRKTHHHGIHP